MSGYARPQFSRREVNRAGETFIDPSSTDQQREHAIHVIDNWRSSHNFPLNTFQQRLRNTAKKINADSLVVQRIKRLESIKLKLQRFPGLNLAQIQDFGGCRAIMKNVYEVDELVDIYKHKSSGIKHKLHNEQDYIQYPKPSGYRGVHLIYKYLSDKNNYYNDLRIEIQVRTLLQHAWATAVEIVGAFINQSLKSSQGEVDWLRFFSLMGSAMAISEGKPTVPNTQDNMVLLHNEISFLAKKLDVEGHLTTFRQSITVLSANKGLYGAKYYLLELDPSRGTVAIKAYTQTQLSVATQDYATLEKRISNSNRNAVLVSADSVDALKLAYPNYYLDADLFLNYLRTFINTQQLSLFG